MSNSLHRIDEKLRGQICTVDRFACAAAAAVLSSYERPPAPQRASTDSGAVLAFKLAVTAICHDINWDFLTSRLESAWSNTGELDLARRLASVTARDIEHWLSGYKDPDRVKAKERAALLQDVGQKLLDTFGGNALAIYEQANGRLSGDRGFYAALDAFEAYRADPLRKKTNVLVHDLVRERVFGFSDMQNIRPAVDYHLIRIYLRTGRVVPRSDTVAAFLKDGSELPVRQRLDTLMREAVEEAVSLTAFYAALPIPDVNYIEWQLGRSVCTRDGPKCLDDSDLAGIPPDVKAIFSGRCPYTGFCPSFRDSEWRAMSEPEFKSSFY